MSETDIIILSWLLVILFLSMNAFFVASEFALVSVRHTRLAQLANEGNKNAEIALKAVSEIDKYIAATQIGITIASIGLGWVAEEALVKLILPVFNFIPWINAKLGLSWISEEVFEKLILPVFNFIPGINVKLITAHSLAIIIAFALITLTHVLLGELIPKSIALQYTEKTALFIAKPMHFAATICKPLIWTLNGLGNFILKMLHIEPGQHHAHTTEELNMLIDASYNDGVINETEKDMIQNVFKFSDLTAKQVMIPRTDMTCIPSDITLEELNKITCETQYTRYPVYENDIDNIIGILHIKDIYASYLCGEFNIEKLIRKPMMVPETVNVDRLMRNFKEQQNQMAIVIDEFGGTSGIITLEDVLEEICGEVQDEFDSDEVADLVKISENCYELNPMMRTDEFYENFEVHIEDEDVETVGGFVVKQLGRLAELNDVVVYQNIEFIVKEISKTRIEKLRINIIPKEIIEEEKTEN